MTKDKILQYFLGNSDLHVLFVFDTFDSLGAELRDVDWPQGYRYVQFDGRWFNVKYNLQHDWKNDNVILVMDSSLRPTNLEERKKFPLYGELKANMEFRNESYETFMQIYGIPNNFASFVAQNSSEFQLQRVNKLLSPYFNPTDFSIEICQRGIISSYLKQERILQWEEIIMRVITLCGNSSERPKMESLFRMLTNNTSMANALSEKFKQYFGQEIKYNTLPKVQNAVEAFKYNAITQNLSVCANDDYKAYKISSAYDIQALSRFVQYTIDNSSDKFEAAVDNLASGIKEDKIIEWYGADADYAYITDKLCAPIISRMVDDGIGSDPVSLNNKITSLTNKFSFESKYKPVLEFLSFVCLTYEKIQGLGSLCLRTPIDYIQKYRDEFYLIDMYYRKAIGCFRQLDPTLLVYESIKTAKQQFDSDYAKIVNQFNAEWIKCVDESQSELASLDNIPHQQNFFKDNVSGVQHKIVVIVSDALRYEVAVQLMHEMSEKKHSVELKSALAMLPTETMYCKDALLPYSELRLADNGMLVDGNVLSGADGRTRHIQRYHPDAVCVTYKTVLNNTLDSNRELFKRPIVYIYHDTIDEMCHTNPDQMSAACELAVDQLTKLIASLHASYNVQHLILTADHGFLYNDITFADKDKHKITETSIDIKTRYYLCQSNSGAGAPGFGIVKFPLPSVSAIKDDVYVAVPNGSNRLFARGGGYEFAHGGATIQEMLIPVVFSSLKRTDTKQKVSVKLFNNKLEMQSSQLKVTLIQSDPVSSDLKEMRILCGVYNAAGALVTNEKEIKLDKTDTNPSNRIIQTTLSLSVSSADPLLFLKIFDVDDRVNPIIKENVKNSTFIEQDF